MVDKISRRGFLKSSVLSSMGISGLFKTAVSADKHDSMPFGIPDYISELVINNPQQFKIMQISDMHLDAGTSPRDMEIIEALPRLVEFAKPDMLMVAGDMWHENEYGKGLERMNLGINLIQSFGVPWAFVWGNHDKLSDYNVGHAAFTNANNSLYKGSADQGHYLVQIKNTEGAHVWDLLCLNSCVGGTCYGLDWNAQKWISDFIQTYATIEHASHAFSFFHIPIYQYKQVWESGNAVGVKKESVHFGDHNDRDVLNLFKQLGTMRACFCGHDHINDYGGLYDEIEVVYGRRTGGYGDADLAKGVKLITMNCETGEYGWKSILFDFSTEISTGIKTFDPAIPEGFFLEQNYPNPFNPCTNIIYTLPTSEHVRIKVFNILGEEIKTLISTYQQAGTYTLRFEAGDLPGGVYIYQLITNSYKKSRKMTLSR